VRTALVVALLSFPAAAAAEPIFLSRQYTRCTTCHFSPTGGGLLTPYGRSLSREELSTFGGGGGGAPGAGREHEFLYGALGDALGAVSLGISLRPAHLDIEGPGFEETRDFLMNAELTAAFRRDKWTAYAQVGRQPRGDDARVTSFEHWLGYQGERAGVRAGRFLPAYGVRFADHTTVNRDTLGLDNDDQVYALEGSFTGARHLVQVAAGVAADGEHAFTASARWQVDVAPRFVLVGSGLYRDAADLAPRSSAVGLAAGFAPFSRLAIWTQGDLRMTGDDDAGHAYTAVADVSLEVYRGVWIRVSPQLATAFGDSSGGVMRWMVGLNLLPRTHWNVILNWYRDEDRLSGVSAETIMAQLHLYL
jgi:hypothetical protein